MLQYFSMLVGFNGLHMVALLYNLALAEICVGLSQCNTYVLQASSAQDSAPVETPPLLVTVPMEDWGSSPRLWLHSE